MRAPATERTAFARSPSLLFFLVDSPALALTSRWPQLHLRARAATHVGHGYASHPRGGARKGDRHPCPTGSKRFSLCVGLDEALLRLRHRRAHVGTQTPTCTTLDVLSDSDRAGGFREWIPGVGSGSGLRGFWGSGGSGGRTGLFWSRTGLCAPRIDRFPSRKGQCASRIDRFRSRKGLFPRRIDRFSRRKGLFPIRIDRFSKRKAGKTDVADASAPRKARANRRLRLLTPVSIADVVFGGGLGGDRAARPGSVGASRGRRAWFGFTTEGTELHRGTRSEIEGQRARGKTAAGRPAGAGNALEAPSWQTAPEGPAAALSCTLMGNVRDAR